MRDLIRAAVFAAFAVFAVATLAQTETPPSPSPKSSVPAAEELPLDALRVFAEVFGKIKSEYIDPAGDVDLLRDAIHGMLAGLDPHSVFLDPKEFEDMRVTTSGKFGGLGIEIITADGVIKVVAPIDDTPAKRAGIIAGDIIIMLDGKPVSDMDLRDAVGSLRGPPGSEVTLTISREDNYQSGEEIFDVTLTRAIINVASVKSRMLEPDFGYVRVTRFQTGTGASLRENISKLTRENERALKGIALDLRDNPGGVLQGAIEVSDAFLDSGVIVSTRGRSDNADYRADSPDMTADVPVVVLVNGGSASAAEIVAGALQDHKRAIILGTQTFGKGSVQTVIPVENGGALKLTTARYYTPANRSIQARGIVPDIIVESRAPALRKKFRELREEDLAGHLENEDGALDFDSDAASLIRDDFQLSEALNLLKGMSLVKLRGDNAVLDSHAPASSAGENSGEG